MFELIKWIGPAVIATISGIVSALVAARLRVNELEKQFQFKTKELAKQIEFKRLEEGERELVAIRMTYIDTLHTCAADLLARMNELLDILGREDDSDRNYLRQSFERIVTDSRDDPREFAIWCNYGGYNAVSTLYLTALFFARLSKTRSEFPFTKISSDYGESLRINLTSVRTSFGGLYGVWENIQDSIGDYISRRDGSIYNYKEFCEDLIDKHTWIWFYRLIDFYKDIESKKAHELPRIIGSLNSLVAFLNSAELCLLKSGSDTEFLGLTT